MAIIVRVSRWQKVSNIFIPYCNSVSSKFYKCGIKEVNIRKIESITNR